MLCYAVKSMKCVVSLRQISKSHLLLHDSKFTSPVASSVCPYKNNHAGGQQCKIANRWHLWETDSRLDDKFLYQLALFSLVFSPESHTRIEPSSITTQAPSGLSFLSSAVNLKAS